MNYQEFNRRPLASRSTRWAQAIARNLAKRNVPTPNQISVASILFALIGGLLLAYWPTITGLIIAAICIQFRLLCNLLDGMVALEGGKKTSDGVLYNEIPDRIADTLLILGLGFAIDMVWLAWLGALLAMATAYIRVLGGALGVPQRFTGPMAKQQRMALLTVACLLGSLELYLWQSNYALWIATMGILLGSLVTCVVRTRDIAHDLKKLTQGQSL